MESILKVLEQIQDLRAREINADGTINPEIRFEVDKLVAIAIDLVIWIVPSNRN